VLTVARFAIVLDGVRGTSLFALGVPAASSVGALVGVLGLSIVDPSSPSGDVLSSEKTIFVSLLSSLSKAFKVSLLDCFLGRLFETLRSPLF